MSAITIFHTNDLHNKLTPAKAARLRDLKASVPGSILLDAGDAIWAGNIFFRPGGEPVLKVMNDARYDAMAMGNREYHFLASGLRKKTSLARFPVLCANIRSRGGADLPSVSSVAFERASLRVVVFGLTLPMITERMLASRISGHAFEDPIETAARLVPTLREQADILVALTHIGLKRDRELASSVPGIDLIVGGHTHALLQEPEFVGKTAIVQAGWYGHHVGKVEIEPDGQVRGELIPL